MSSLSVVMFVTVFSSVVCLESVMDHIARVNNFTCKIPQPRFRYLRDLVTEDQWKKEYQNKTIRPLGTIVHECTASGCCSDYNERCLPKQIEEITVNFIALSKKVETFTLTIINHTECSCQQMQKENQIKKKKK